MRDGVGAKKGGVADAPWACQSPPQLYQCAHQRPAQRGLLGARPLVLPELVQARVEHLGLVDGQRGTDVLGVERLGGPQFQKRVEVVEAEERSGQRSGKGWGVGMRRDGTWALPFCRWGERHGGPEPVERHGQGGGFRVWRKNWSAERGRSKGAGSGSPGLGPARGRCLHCAEGTDTQGEGVRVTGLGGNREREAGWQRLRCRADKSPRPPLAAALPFTTFLPTGQAGARPQCSRFADILVGGTGVPEAESAMARPRREWLALGRSCPRRIQPIAASSQGALPRSSNPSSTESVRQEGSAQFALAGSVPPHARAEAGTMARRVEPFAGWKLIVVAACELSTRNHRTTRGLL